MKLPEITYGPTQTSSQDVGQMGAAARQAGGVIEQGLTALGHELVRTQAQTASLRLDQNLSAIEQDLAGRQFVTETELKGMLGADFNSLPTETRQRLTESGLDIASGEVVKTERQVPMWEVAGEVYKLRARRALDDAATAIQAPGWAEEFKAQAAPNVLQRQNKIVEGQLGEMHAYLQEQQLGNVLSLARIGRYDQAYAEIASSRAIPPSLKEKAKAEVLRMEEDGRSLEAGVEASQPRLANGILVDIDAGQKALDAMDLPAAIRERAQRVFEDRVRTQKAVYDQTLGQQILAAKAAWENGDRQRGVLPYANPEIAVPQEVQLFLRNKDNPGGPDAWEALLGWYHARVNVQRTNAQLPTAYQTEQAAELEASIVRETTQGGTMYRNMPPETFVKTWAPQLTESQFNRVFQVFLAANGKGSLGAAPPRIVSDRQILLDEMNRAGLAPKARGTAPGVKPTDPNTWTPETTSASAWEDFSEQLGAWRAGHPNASDADVRKETQRMIASEVGTVFQERAGVFRKKVYGFELRRSRKLNAADYVPISIPPAVDAALRARFAAHGVSNPTPEQLTKAYSLLPPGSR